MIRRETRTLRSKLLHVVVSTMLAAGLMTLGASAAINYSMEQERLAETEVRIRDGISSKGRTLVTSHALSLRGLVADNAFGDVRELVASAVRDDSDLIYAYFADSDSKLWVYVSPTHRDAEATDDVDRDRLLELGAPATENAAERIAQRPVQAFGMQIQESSAPVISLDGERLGTVVYGFSTERMRLEVAAAGERSRRELTNALAISGLSWLLCLCMGIARVIRSAQRLTKPVTELTAVANEIATGKRGIRADVDSGDEMDVLADAFNQMLRANEDALSELEVRTAQALAADKLKGEFLANMSHEIRTPMNGVLGMVQLIRSMQLDGKLRRYFETIDVSANALLTIVNDILDFSKLEAGKYTLSSTRFEPRAVVQDVVDLLAGRAYEKGLEVIYRASPELPEVVIGDPDRLRQVLSNLVGNAIKFTDRGEIFVDVNVIARAPSLTVGVSVYDTGIGISAEDLPKLFEAFSQVDGTLVRRHGGTGLGLAISKRLVDMMNGQMHVESEPGRGSTFSFTVQFQTAEQSPASVRVPCAPLPGRSILVAEGNRRQRELLGEQLRAWQIECALAETAAAALHCLRASRHGGAGFDTLLIADNLADMPASELARAARQHASSPGLAVILVSPAGAEEPSGAAPEAACLHKPIRVLELYDCIASRGAAPVSRVNRVSDALLPPARSGARGTVLVVDDNDINRFVVVEELGRRGYAVEEALGGQEAIDRVESHEYSCVLMDCQMPLVDGYSATRAIRHLEARHGRARMPIIALTAHALAGERERVLSAGMDDILSKPFRPSALDRLLRAYMPASAPGQAPASRSISADGPALDPAAFRSEKLSRIFLERLPAQLTQLTLAVERRDPTEIQALAHKLKGSCLAVAAEPMSKALENMRQLVESSDYERLGAELQRVRLLYAQVEALLLEELSLAKTAAAPLEHGGP